MGGGERQQLDPGLQPGLGRQPGEADPDDVVSEDPSHAAGDPLLLDVDVDLESFRVTDQEGCRQRGDLGDGVGQAVDGVLSEGSGRQ